MKKGYTLIELIIVIAMITILESTFLISVKIYKNLSNCICTKACSNGIQNFIDNCRQYCRVNNKEGRIQFHIENNEIDFIVNLDIKSKLKLEGSNKLCNTSLSDNTINVKKDGSVNACTIKYRDDNGKLHIITICVGTTQENIIK